MGLFSRKTVAQGHFRVTGVTRNDSSGVLILSGVPQQSLHVDGLIEIDGQPPQAAAYDVRMGTDRSLQVGQVLDADIVKLSPLKAHVRWEPDRVQQQVAAARADAGAQVIAQLAGTGAATHAAGVMDPVGIALSDPSAAGTIAQQLAASLGTPISMDIDEGGVTRHVVAGGGGHLTTADAAELQRTGTTATARIAAATRVPVPQAMMPNPEATLWDLDLEVHRADGSTYRAQTRVGFRSEARRAVLGAVGLDIPVRTDPADDSRVAVDSARFDAEHPDAPKG